MARNSTTSTSRKNANRKNSNTRSRTSGSSNTSNTTSRTNNTNTNSSQSRKNSGTTSPFGTTSFDSMFKNFPQAAANFGFPQNTTSCCANPFTSNFNMDQVRDQMTRLGMMSGYNNATRSGKDTVDAAIKSSQALAKAAEELSKAIYSFTQSSMELGVQAGQAVLNVRTLKDLVDVQSEYARNSMDHLISGTSRISDMAVKIANEVMEPLNQRMSDAVEKMGKAA